MATIGIRGLEFGSADEALQDAAAEGRGETVVVAGHYFVVEATEADRLAEAGVPFAYMAHHWLAGGTDRVLTIPVN